MVFGDIERSPRIQNHTNSLLANGYKVDLIAYADSNDTSGFIDKKFARNCRLLCLKHPKKLNFSARSKVFSSLLGLQRVMGQLMHILYYLFRDAINRMSIELPAFILIQIPPSMPTLLIAKGMSVIFKIPLIIDWHNFGFSILNLESSNASKLVSIARWYEISLGKSANIHLTVTNAMKSELEKWPVSGSLCTLYDKAPKKFKVTTEQENMKVLHPFNGSS
jgi:beta-1,4-mannosyltransferase